jgi:transaldolase
MKTSSLSVKVYSDGADHASMVEMAKNPMIQGLTTNPTLMKKAGITNYREFCLGVLKDITDKPISFEVFTDDLLEMKRQAQEIAKWAKNVYVKIPITNTEGLSTLALVRELSHQGININVTAILTLEQVAQTVAALKDGAPSVVSVFAGRIADTGRDPKPIMEAAAALCRAADPSAKKIELLWASCREVFNIVEADQTGCQIVTAAPDLIKKMSMFGKELDILSLETVRMFRTDAVAAGFNL